MLACRVHAQNKNLRRVKGGIHSGQVSPPTTIAPSANSGPPQPIEKSPAVSAPIGARTSSPPSGPSSAPPLATASTPTQLFSIRYAGSLFSPQDERIQKIQTRTKQPPKSICSRATV